MTAQEYQIGLSTLFVGYVLMQVPSNALLNYAGRPSLYIGFFVIIWGLVSACTSQVKTAGQIIACRFILGFVEAPFFPGILFYLSKWYTREELSLRMAIFYSGSLISGAFGNLIAAGILTGLAGQRGYSAWQWLYIVEGAITVFVSHHLISAPGKVPPDMSSLAFACASSSPISLTPGRSSPKKSATLPTADSPSKLLKPTSIPKAACHKSEASS